MKILLVIGLVIIAGQNCSENNLRNATMVTLDKNERVETTYNDDNKIHGQFKVYYHDSGSLKYECVYNNGKVEGVSFQYFENGVLSHKSTFVNGIKKGYSIEYDENAVILGETFWKYGRPFGIVKLYYQSKRIRLIYFQDFDEQNFFVIKYDSLGRVTEEEGLVFSPSILYNCNIDSMPINAELVAQIPVVVLPNLETELRMGLTYNELEILKIYNFEAKYKTIFDSLGEYELKTIGILRNADGTEYSRDTVVNSIRVVD